MFEGPYRYATLTTVIRMMLPKFTEKLPETEAELGEILRKNDVPEEYIMYIEDLCSEAKAPSKSILIQFFEGWQKTDNNSAESFIMNSEAFQEAFHNMVKRANELGKKKFVDELLEYVTSVNNPNRNPNPNINLNTTPFPDQRWESLRQLYNKVMPFGANKISNNNDDPHYSRGPNI